MKVLRILILIIFLLPASHLFADGESSVHTDSVADKTQWVRQLIKNGGHINDSTMNYPKFPRFVVDIYNWGDSLFNSYNPEYVIGSGKNWKINGKSFNYMENFTMMFGDYSMMNIRSNVFSDFGVNLSFMAVSVGYTAKIDQLLGKAKNNRRNFDFSFTCCKLHLDLNYTMTEGACKITRLGDYHRTVDFDDIRLWSLSVDAMYIFNNRKYSHAAAYCFSKYQLKSAGSWILGASVNHQKLRMDFSGLAPELRDELPGLATLYRLKYTDYDILGGYAYNYVIRPKRWLFNITALPSVGYRYSYKASTVGMRDTFSANFRATTALVYNHRAMFVGLHGQFTGHLYYNNGYAMLSSLSSLSLNVGARF